MTDPRPARNWVRVLQGLGLFLALAIALPWIGGKLIPGRGSPPQPAGAEAQHPSRPAPQHDQPAQPAQDTPAQPPADELAQLPQWQQDLLNDPAWATPDAAPDAVTPDSAVAKLDPSFDLTPVPPQIAKTMGQWQKILLGDPGWTAPWTGPAGVTSSDSAGPNVKVSVTLPKAKGGGSYQAYAVNTAEGRGCLVRLHVSISGGIPDSRGRYKYVTWSFGDANPLYDVTAFNDDTLDALHFFTAPAGTPKAYFVRVQVLDAAGTIAYGDSLPIVVR